MRLSDKHLRELIAIYKDVHGEILSNEQAQEAGLAIVRLVLVKELNQCQLIKEENLNNGKNNDSE